LQKDGKEVNLKKNKNIKVSWKSSNTKVVKINETHTEYSEGGEKVYNYIYASVVPVGKGTATVTASYKGASCSYKVTVKGSTIVVGGGSSKTAYVPAGLKMSLYVRGGEWGELNSTDNITWTTENTSIAKITDGEIQGVKEGTTNIVAQSKLGTLKLKVVVLPKYDVQIKNLKDVKKNGKIVGYSFDVVNKGKKDIKVLNGCLVYTSAFEGWLTIGEIKGGKVTVKAGHTKKITVSDSNSAGVSDSTLGIEVKYEGHTFSISYDEKGKPMTVYLGKLGY
jgi:hypothetical protein